MMGRLINLKCTASFGVVIATNAWLIIWDPVSQWNLQEHLKYGPELLRNAISSIPHTSRMVNLLRTSVWH